MFYYYFYHTFMSNYLYMNPIENVYLKVYIEIIVLLGWFKGKNSISMKSLKNNIKVILK